MMNNKTSKPTHPNPNDKYFVYNLSTNELMERCVFLKNIITNPNIIVGDYTYYDDPVDVNNFHNNVLNHFDFIGDKLIIGKFCQIATNVKFMMNGAHHDLAGLSAFPFITFNSYWPEVPYRESKAVHDTVIGNDVWFGYDALIMPGITIGDGAVIGTRSIVTKDVAPYTIVAGNPARVIRKRFDDETIDFLLKLQWWNWNIDKIRQNVIAIMNCDKETLSAQI